MESVAGITKQQTIRRDIKEKRGTHIILNQISNTLPPLNLSSIQGTKRIAILETSAIRPHSCQPCQFTQENSTTRPTPLTRTSLLFSLTDGSSAVAYLFFRPSPKMEVESKSAPLNPPNTFSERPTLTSRNSLSETSTTRSTIGSTPPAAQMSSLSTCAMPMSSLLRTLN